MLCFWLLDPELDTGLNGAIDAFQSEDITFFILE